MDKKTIIGVAREKLGIENLNPMQLAVLSIDGSRIVLLAPTGSGKTLGFAIAVLKKLKPRNGLLQAVIVAPSRELAIQTGEVVRRVAIGYKTSVFYGGHPMAAEVDSIEGGMPDIVVATPGRMTDHIKRNTLDLSTAGILVLDEYDKILDLGFIDQIKTIRRALPNKLGLTMLTSATRPAELPEFLGLENSEEIDYSERVEAPRNRMQVVEVVSPLRDKLPVLEDLLLCLPPDSKTIVFVNHRESADRIYQQLKKRGFAVGLYHGGLEQREREQAVDLLNNETTPILVATDLASRGLDIDSVGQVVHYHHAPSEDVWTHRNGRTARVDANGVIYSITSEDETVPEFEIFDRQLVPNPSNSVPALAKTATLFVNAGKREKISRGDIAGFLMQQAFLEKGEVGKIVIKDHSALVAVPADKVSQILKEIEGKKLKNKSVRISRVKP